VRRRLKLCDAECLRCVPTDRDSRRSGKNAIERAEPAIDVDDESFATNLAERRVQHVHLAVELWPIPSRRAVVRPFEKPDDIPVGECFGRWNRRARQDPVAPLDQAAVSFTRAVWMLELRHSGSWRVVFVREIGQSVPGLVNGDVCCRSVHRRNRHWPTRAAILGVVHQQESEVVIRDEIRHQLEDFALAVAVVSVTIVRRNRQQPRDVVGVVAAVEIRVAEHVARRVIGAGLGRCHRDREEVQVVAVLAIGFGI
jgi:hypothetical protein